MATHNTTAKKIVKTKVPVNTEIQTIDGTSTIVNINTPIVGTVIGTNSINTNEEPKRRKNPRKVIQTEVSEFVTEINNSNNTPLNRVLINTVNEEPKRRKNPRKNVHTEESVIITEKNIRSKAKPKSKSGVQIEKDVSYLRLPDNEIIFELNNDNDVKNNIASILSVIDRAHNILHKNENIVGQKALPIIMSLLFLKLIQPLLSDKKEDGKIDLLNKEYYTEIFDDDEELQKIFSYFTNFKNLIKQNHTELRCEEHNDAIRQMGEILKRHHITKNIYKEVNFIKVNNGTTVKELLEVINNFNFKDFENNEDVIGEIYEHFLTKYLKSNSKELGQFFTPRKLMKLILNYKKSRINELFEGKENVKVYDSCMGTGGWLVSAYNMLDELNCSLSGGEVESDTYQYGLMNLILTIKKFPNNVDCNSSLTHINNNKYDLITTNPPFNSKNKIKFSTIKTNFDNDNYTKSNKININDVYKLEKDDPPIQFLELDTYKLDENGMCIIVLPYGEFFSGSSYQKTREHFMKEVNITDIILVPGGIFTHTDIKTCVIIFEKNKSGTQKINFLQINDECNNITMITTAKMCDIMKEPLKSWYHMDYLIDESVDNMCLKMNNFEWIEFGKIFTLEKGQLQSSKVEEVEDGEGVFINLSKTGKYKNINDYLLDGENIFISNTAPLGLIQYYNGKCSYSDLLNHIIPNDNYKHKINIKYIYYFLKKLQPHIEKTYDKGACNKSLDVKNFNRMKIPLPPLEIQNRITNKIYSSNNKVKYMKLIVDSMKEDVINFFDLTIEIENRKDETEWIEFGKVFTLEKGQLQSSKVEEVEEGEYDNDDDNIVIFVTGAKDANFKKIIKQDISYVEGENIFISENGNGDKRPVKYFNGNCNYSDLLSHIKLNDKYNNRINIKYIYYFLKKLQPHIEKTYQKGACNQSLDVKNFNRMKIQIPILEQQNKCIDKMNEMEEIIKRWENDIEDIITNGSNKFLEFLEYESIKYETE